MTAPARPAIMTPKDLGFNFSETGWRAVSEQPTGRELDILKVLWEHGPCSVREVHRHLDEPDLAYNTVQTLLQRLRSKGYVRSDARALAHVFTPCVTREQIIRKRLHEVGESFDHAGDIFHLRLTQTQFISGIGAQLRRKLRSAQFVENRNGLSAILLFVKRFGL